MHGLMFILKFDWPCSFEIYFPEIHQNLSLFFKLYFPVNLEIKWSFDLKCLKDKKHWQEISFLQLIEAKLKC